MQAVMGRSIGATAGLASASCPGSTLPRRPALLSRASRVERALRALWLYRLAPGGRARRSVLSEASTVRRVSWRVFRAAAADLLAGDKRLYEAAPVPPHPARPSVMSQQLKSHSRQARGSTTEALPQQALSFAHSTHTQHSWMVVSRALRANYDHQPGPDAVPHWCQRTGAPQRAWSGGWKKPWSALHAGAMVAGWKFLGEFK